MNPPPDIFLSYNREDAAVAKLFADAFAREGLNVWWDQTLRSGETYDEVTETALRGANAVVVLWSPRSVASHWVRAEATIAHRAKTLIPATIEPCDKPVMFELTQTAELSHWRGEVRDPAWRAFLGDVQRKVGSRPQASVLGSAPLAEAAHANPGRPFVAILPFLNRSDLSEDQYVVEELAEELTARLAASPWMEVATASSTAAYDARAHDPRQIGRELGARYLLEGSVRRAGPNLRVTAQLTAAEESKILCTRKFERPHAELALTSDDLALEIGAMIGDQIQRAEIERAFRKTVGGTPWEAFMRAVGFYSRATLSGYEAAAAEARRALELDPDYAFAFAILLSAQSMLVMYNGTDCAMAREMVDTIRAARSTDPDSVGVLAGCAAAFASLRRPQDALPLAERAAAMYPDLDWSRASLGLALVQLGRAAEALPELEIADRLAPNTVANHHDMTARSVAHVLVGRIDEASEAAERAVRLHLNPASLLQLALCQVWSTDWDGARDTVRRLRDTDPGLSLQHIENLVRYFYCGSDRTDKCIGTARNLWSDVEGSPS
jgi:TolB-like protein